MMNFARFFPKESKVYALLVKAEQLKRPRDTRSFLKPYSPAEFKYDTDQLQICMVSKDRKIFTRPTNCRDYLIEAIRFHITNGKAMCHHALLRYGGELDRDNLRFLMLLDVPFQDEISQFDGIKNGLRVADMYGRVAGWRKSRLVKCLIDAPSYDNSGPRKCYLVVADKNWQRMPQFVSMFTLLIRVCLHHQVPDWVQDAYSLQGYWHELFTTDGRPSTRDFYDFLYNSYDRLLTLVAHEREIFPYDIDGGYNTDLRHFHPKSGLASLINDDSTHPKSATMLEKLYTGEVSKG